MFTSLVSMMTQRTVLNDVAMTGEISLRGLVLPVGGIKEKVVAAARSGIKTVILPARNRRDYDEIPQSVRKALRFVWAERVDDVVAAAFEGGLTARKGAIQGAALPRSRAGQSASPAAGDSKPVSAPRPARRRRAAGRDIRLRADSPRSRDP
jgi:hypothetical protein